MSVLSRRILDGPAPEWYQRSVDVPYTAPLDTPAETSTPGRKRRRPPSLPEQQRRTQRIVPWADTWKQLKASGRWH